jgi:hypothetical protein
MRPGSARVFSSLAGGRSGVERESQSSSSAPPLNFVKSWH